jgi:hypothetical protein
VIALQIVTGAVLFLAAAKAHGQQLRLEREKAGVLRVSFGRGSQNDPFVVTLWRRERFLFWPAAALTAIALHFLARSLPWPLVYVEIPGAVGFCLGGLLSLARTGRPAPGWRGSVIWWLLTSALAVGLGLLVVRG